MYEACALSLCVLIQNQLESYVSSNSFVPVIICFILFFATPVLGRTFLAFRPSLPACRFNEIHYTIQDGSFTIHGMADLEDVCTSLAFQQVMHQIRRYVDLIGVVYNSSLMFSVLLVGAFPLKSPFSSQVKLVTVAIRVVV